MSFFLRELLSFTFRHARAAFRLRLHDSLNALYAVFKVLLVGSSGLEPPTSRLSGVRSNQLSYEPMFASYPGRFFR
jgi:hypothetical protein